MTYDEFRSMFSKLRLRFAMDPEIGPAYYEFLQTIPADRFGRIVDSIFCTETHLPPPQKFLDLSCEMAQQEINARSPKDLLALEGRDFTEEECAANRARLAEMMRSCIKQPVVAKKAPALPVIQKEDPGAELVRLNNWVKDPILRDAAIAAVRSRPDLTIVLGDDGAILGVARAA